MVFSMYYNVKEHVYIHVCAYECACTYIIYGVYVSINYLCPCNAIDLTGQ